MFSKATRPASSKDQNNMFKTQNFQHKIAYQHPSFGSNHSFAVPSSRALQDNMDHSLYCQQRLFGGSFHSYPNLAGYRRNAVAVDLQQKVTQGEVRSTTEMKTKTMEQSKLQIGQREKRNATLGNLLLTSMANIKNEVKDELEKCKDSGDIQKLITAKFGQCNEMLKKLTLSYQQLGSNLDRIEGAVAEQFHEIENHIGTNKEKIQKTQEAMSNHIIQQHNMAWKKLDKFGNGVKSFVQRSKSQPRGRDVTVNIKKQVSFIKTKIVTESVKRSKSAVPPVRNNIIQKRSLKRKSDEVYNKEKNEFNPQLKKIKLLQSNEKQESNRMVTRSFMQLKPLANPITTASNSKTVTFSKLINK